jgi:hypothetical protein
MHRFLLIILVPFACSAGQLKPTLRPTEWGEGQQGVILERQIAGIEASAPAIWREFRTGADTRGAHTSETFSVACAYLIRRDPTFFLRRYLSGDAYAIPCGKRAYGWSGKQYQRVLDSVYRFRLLEAKLPTERQKIEQFIAPNHERDLINHAMEQTADRRAFTLETISKPSPQATRALVRRRSSGSRSGVMHTHRLSLAFVLLVAVLAVGCDSLHYTQYVVAKASASDRATIKRAVESSATATGLADKTETSKFQTPLRSTLSQFHIFQ